MTEIINQPIIPEEDPSFIERMKQAANQLLDMTFDKLVDGPLSPQATKKSRREQ